MLSEVCVLVVSVLLSGRNGVSEVHCVNDFDGCVFCLYALVVVLEW